MSFRTLTSGWGPLRGDDTAVKRAFDLPTMLVCVVWIGGARKGGGVGRASSFAEFCPRAANKEARRSRSRQQDHKNGSVDFDVTWQCDFECINLCIGRKKIGI